MNQEKTHRIGNIFGLCLLCIILTTAFFEQFYQPTLPCPLCLLQRGCFITIGLCLCLNIRFGIKTSHYSLMTLAALLGLGTALRQIFLHFSPDNLGYGSNFLGFHLYVWSSIIFATIIGLIGIALLFNKGFSTKINHPNPWCFVLMIFFLILILGNVVSTFIECGTRICPANPMHYYILDKHPTIIK